MAEDERNHAEEVETPTDAPEEQPNGARQEEQPEEEDASVNVNAEEEATRTPISEPPVIVTTDEQASGATEPFPPAPQDLEPSTPSVTQPTSPPAPDVAQHRTVSIASTPRLRTDSTSTTATSATQRGGTRSSLVFVTTALETIAASKDAKKNKRLGDSLQRALSAIRSPDGNQMSPEVLFEPLALATEAYDVKVVTTALDCIGKLISYSYFSQPPEATAEGGEGTPLIEKAIDTICDCFQSEATPVETQLQIVKSLLAAILNDKIVVHGAGLLKAVRLTYNIFLLSKSSANQQVAQGALTQMVGTVFERVKARLAIKEAKINLSKTSFGEKDSDEG
ncbi:hypothetical protein LTS18_012770, partial [Coniosporium uncinatum]